jgi:protein SCO1/2
MIALCFDNEDRSMKLQACVTPIMAVLIVMTGCDRSGPVPKVVASQEVASSKTYGMKGVVRELDPATGGITISHEEIVGFMPRMTMPFSVKNHALLEGIKSGDEVEGTLQVDRAGDTVKELYLTELKVVRRGPSTAEKPVTTPAIAPQILKPGDLVPDFTMTTQEGKTLKLADLRGKVVVLSFIYTRCPSPEFCPAMDTKFAELARRIGTVASRAEQVRLLSVSFDPEHDTPEVLQAHASRRGAKPPLWTFAVASHEELSKVAGPLGLTYVPGTQEIEHNLRAAVIGPDGRLATVAVGKDWTPIEVVKTVYGLIPDAGK